MRSKARYISKIFSYVKRKPNQHWATSESPVKYSVVSLKKFKSSFLVKSLGLISLPASLCLSPGVTVASPTFRTKKPLGKKTQKSKIPQLLPQRTLRPMLLLSYFSFICCCWLQHAAVLTTATIIIVAYSTVIRYPESCIRSKNPKFSKTVQIRRFRLWLYLNRKFHAFFSVSYT